MAEPASTDNQTQGQDTLSIEETITVRDLAEKLNVSASELITELIAQGVMAAINDRVDFATAAKAAEKFGVHLAVAEASKKTTTKAAKGQGAARPPIVAVMGHVDHGKTTLLDKIRQTKVAAGEAGGITQHLRAHQVVHKGQKITFLDTPGHEAFAILREHGAHLTDVALIVVAADDGIKPQTQEAIDFAKKAGVKIVVAITKIDRPGADVDRVKKQLADKGLNPEEWGGDTIMVEVSGVTGEGIDKLLEMLMLVAEVEELAARAEGPAKGTVIETHLAKGKGTLATLLVEEGQLKTGDFVSAPGAYAKIRQLQDTEGTQLKAAGPSTPAVVSGWKDLPELGQSFEVVADEKTARASSQQASGEEAVATKTKLREHAGAQAATKSQAKQFLLVIKADVHGSLEALAQSLEKLGGEQSRVKVVSQGLGDINESDVSLAQSTGARVIGFNVAVPVKIKQLAQQQKVDIKIYTVIYELLEEVEAELAKLVEPKIVETKQAELEVRGIFKVTANNLICGGLVKNGKIRREQLVRLIKGGESVEVGKVVNVQKEQQEVKEVVEGDMCGLSINTDKKAKVNVDDTLEFISREAQK